MGNEQLLTELGRGRVLVHCARIEGHSRLAAEARLMGTCCVGLASNRFAVGFDEDAGGALVDRLEDVVGVVERILADPDELRRRQARARVQARSATDWKLFVQRVGHALAAIEAETERSDAPWRDVAAQLARRERDLNDTLARLRARPRYVWRTLLADSCRSESVAASAPTDAMGRRLSRAEPPPVPARVPATCRAARRTEP